MIMRLLASQEIQELESVAVALGLASMERRTLLFEGLPNSFIESLPVCSRPSDQFRSDLSELNCTPEILGMDIPPFITWLENAIRIVHPRPEVEVFSRVRNSLVYAAMGTSSGKKDAGNEELRSRLELIQASLTLLTRPTHSYRATIVGPLFLHPVWYMERRNRKVQIPNYDEALANFIQQYGRDRTHEIRLIFTFSERYRAKVDLYVDPSERGRFQKELLEAVDALWGPIGDRGPDLCCVHPGFLHIPTIFDNAVITTYRPSQLTPTSEGLLSYSSDIVRRERSLFDTIFDTCSQGQEEELKKLKEHISKLW
jgi:hypothetical protein